MLEKAAGHCTSSREVLCVAILCGAIGGPKRVSEQQRRLIQVSRTKGAYRRMNEETASLVAAIRAAPAGTFKIFRATENEPEVEQSMRNWDEVSRRIAHARTANCLIEVVSSPAAVHGCLAANILREHSAYRQAPAESGRLLSSVSSSDSTRISTIESSPLTDIASRFPWLHGRESEL